MNKSKKRLILSGILVIVTLSAAVAFAADPGTDGDPLVTKSYIDSVIEELKSYVDEKLSGFDNAAPEGVETMGASYELVRLASGQRITFGEGAELIVRMGKGSVIASEKGGIADVTAGYDLEMGEITSANHLLIVPVDDGRGFEAVDDVIVMVKGSYKIN